MRKISFILIVIIVFAFILRTWQLASIPPGLHADEADITYAAYSILKTGKTHYNEFNLLALKENAGVTRPPLLTFATIPSVWLLGLNLWGVRMPSVVFGVGTIIMLYIFVLQLFGKKSYALIAALFMAVNPWSIHISRQGLLQSISLFFTVSGVALFSLGKRNPKYYLFSAASFGLSLFAYDAPKLFIIPMIVLLAWYYRKDLLKQKRAAILSGAIVVISYLLMLSSQFAGDNLQDFSTVLVYQEEGVVETVNRERHQTNAPLWASSLFHNKLTVGTNHLVRNMFTVLSPDWLFINGHGQMQQAVARHGQYHLFQLPLFFIGIFFLFRKYNHAALLLLGWLFLGVLPGAITSGGNFPYRSVLMMPVPIIFSAVGLVIVWRWIGKYLKTIRYLAYGGIIIIAAAYITSFLFTYFYDYPVYASEFWQQQRNDALKFAIERADQYDAIYVDDTWHIYYAVHEQTDPEVFQEAYQNPVLINDTINAIKIDNFYFANFDIGTDSSTPSAYFPENSLLITGGENFKDHYPLTVFLDPDGVRAVYNIFEIPQKNQQAP